jgi:hypothetical protein
LSPKAALDEIQAKKVTGECGDPHKIWLPDLNQELQTSTDEEEQCHKKECQSERTNVHQELQIAVMSVWNIHIVE